MINTILIALGFRSVQTGSDIVAEVADGFDSMLTKLEEGKDLIDLDITVNQIRITELKEQNKVLGTSKVKALNLIRGIEGIINGR